MFRRVGQYIPDNTHLNIGQSVGQLGQRLGNGGATRGSLELGRLDYHLTEGFVAGLWLGYHLTQGFVAGLWLGYHLTEGFVAGLWLGYRIT